MSVPGRAKLVLDPWSQTVTATHISSLFVRLVQLILKLTGEWKETRSFEQQGGKVCPSKYQAVMSELCVSAGVLVKTRGTELRNRRRDTQILT